MNHHDHHHDQHYLALGRYTEARARARRAWVECSVTLGNTGRDLQRYADTPHTPPPFERIAVAIDRARAAWGEFTAALHQANAAAPHCGQPTLVEADFDDARWTRQ